MKKYLALFLSLIMLCSFMTACAASKSEEAIVGPMYNGAVSDSFDSSMDMGVAEDGYYENESSVEKPSAGTTDTDNSTTQDYLESQKLVYKCYVSLETLKFSETMDAISGLVETFDGFVESNSLSDDSWGWYYSDYNKTSGTMSAKMTIRIPTENYNKFLESLDGQGKIRSKTENVTNITKQYSDTKTTIEVLEKERDMLLEMMDKAISIDDMMVVETRLSQVQRELAIYQSNMGSMNMDINFSTITISVEEVMEYTRETKETTFMERIYEACADSIESFADFLEGFTISIIYLAPYIIIFGSIAVGVIVTVKRKRKAKLATAVISAPAKKVDETSTIETEVKENK